MLDESVKSAITKNLNDIINSDPRIASDGIRVSEYEHGLSIQIDLRYLATNELSTMYLQFNRQE